MITSTLGAQHFRKELEPAIFASESNGRGGEERHFTAEMPGRKVETATLKVGERRGSAASYCRFSHVPSYRSMKSRPSKSGSVSDLLTWVVDRKCEFIA